MSELFTETGINQDALKEYLGDAYYNDPETKQQPTKLFENIKDEKTFVINYINAQKVISSHGEKLKKATEGLVKVPGENATKEEISAYRKATGVPDKPDEYKFNIPDTVSDFDKKGFDAVANAIKPIAHEVGISPSKIGKVWDKVVEVLNQQTAELDKKGKELLEADINATKEKYKDKYDSFVKDGDTGFLKLDTKDNPVATNVINFLNTLGLANSPVFQELKYAISKLTLSDEGHFNNNDSTSQSEDSWPIDYSETVKS